MVLIIAGSKIILYKCQGRCLPLRSRDAVQGEDCLCLSSKSNWKQSNSWAREPGSMQGACTECTEPSSPVPEISSLTSVVDFPKAGRRLRRGYLSRQGDFKSISRLSALEKSSPK